MGGTKSKGSKSNGYSLLDTSNNHASDHAVKFNENLDLIAQIFDDLSKVDATKSKTQKLKQEVSDLIASELNSQNLFENDKKALNSLYTAAETLLNVFDPKLRKDALTKKGASATVKYSKTDGRDLVSYNSLIILLNDVINILKNNQIILVSDAEKSSSIDRSNATSNTALELLITKIKTIGETLDTTQDVYQNLSSDDAKKQIATIQKFAQYIQGNFNDLPQAINALRDKVATKVTAIQQATSDLKEHRDTFVESNNALFIEVVSELLGYYQHYQAEINRLNEEKKSTEKKKISDTFSTQQKKDELETVNEKIAYHEGFAFQIKLSIDKFLKIGWKRQLTNGLSFEKAAIQKLAEKFSSSPSDINKKIAATKGRLSKANSNDGTSDSSKTSGNLIELEDMAPGNIDNLFTEEAINKLKQEINNNNNAGSAPVSTVSITPSKYYNAMHRKQFLALCSMLNEARSNYEKGKAAVQAEFEVEKTKIEKQYAKKIKQNPSDDKLRTHAIDKKEKQARKALYFKVGDKHFAQKENVVHSIPNVHSALATQKDNSVNYQTTKQQLTNDQRELSRIKRNFKHRIITLIEDYRYSAFSGDIEATQKTLLILKILLKIDERPDRRGISSFFQTVGRGLYLTHAGKAGGRKEFENLVSDKNIVKNIQNHKIDKFICNVALELGYIVPETNPHMTLSKYASVWIQKEINKLEAADPTIQRLRDIESKYIKNNLLIPENTDNSKDSKCSTLITMYNKHFRELGVVTHDTLLHGLDTMIDHPWRPILVPRFTESVLGRNLYGMDRDLYEALLRIEQNSIALEQFRHKAKEYDCSITLKELRNKYFNAEKIEKAARHILKTQIFKGKFEAALAFRAQQEYKTEVSKLTPEQFAALEQIVFEDIKKENATQYIEAINTVKTFYVSAFFNDLKNRIRFFNEFVISRSHDPVDTDIDQKRENTVASFVNAFNSLAEKFNIEEGFVKNGDGEYELQPREYVTQQKIVERKLVRNIRALSTLIAILVMVGQVTAAFVGSLVYRAFAQATMGAMTSTLFSVFGISVTATSLIFWPLFIISASLMGFMVLSHLKGLYEVLRPIPVIGHIARLVYGIVTLPIRILRGIGSIPYLGAPFRLLAAIPRFARKHPTIVHLIGTLGILASAFLFPGVGTTLLICAAFSTFCGLTNYLLFKPDVRGLLSQIAEQGVKKVIWDKLGPNRKHLTRAQDAMLMVFNAILAIAGIAGTLALAALLINPLGSVFAAFCVATLAFFAISGVLGAINYRIYNAKKAAMIAVIASIGFTTLLETLFVASFFYGKVAPVLLGLFGFSMAVTAPYVIVATLVLAAVTAFGFFAVYYFCTGDLIAKKPLLKIKNFFKSNFYDENWRMRPWFEKDGKAPVLAKMVLKGFFFATGIGLLGTALYVALSGKAAVTQGLVSETATPKSVNIGRMVAFLAGFIEGMFYGKNITRIFTSLLPKFILNKVLIKGAAYAQDKYAVKARPNATPQRSIFDVKLNSSAKERNFMSLRLIENAKSIFRSEIVRITGTSNSTNALDAATQEKSRETIETTLETLKVRNDVTSAWLRDCTATEANNILVGLKETGVRTVFLSNLTTDVIAQIDASKLPSSVIINDLDSMNIEGLVKKIQPTNNVKSLTFQLGNNADVTLLANSKLQIADSVKELYFACSKAVNDRRNDNYLSSATITANHVTTLVLDNLGATAISNIFKALNGNESIKEIVLKNLDITAIKQVDILLRNNPSLKDVTIVLDGFIKSDKAKVTGIVTSEKSAADITANTTATTDNPIDVLIALHKDNKAKVSNLHFKKVPKKILSSSEKLLPYVKKYEQSVNVANEGNWFTRPFIHFLPRVRQLFIACFQGTALPLNALGNSFSIITSGADSFLRPGAHWVDGPQAPTASDPMVDTVIDGVTSAGTDIAGAIAYANGQHPTPPSAPNPNDLQHVVAGNYLEFIDFWNNNSHSDAIGAAIGAAVDGFGTSYCLNKVNGDSELQNKREIYTEEKVAEASKSNFRSGRNIHDGTENVEPQKPVETSKSAPSTGHAYSKHNFFKNKKLEKIEDKIRETFGLQDALPSTSMNKTSK